MNTNRTYNRTYTSSQPPQNHRRAHSVSRDSDDPLRHLFSRSRRSVSLPSPDDSHVKLGKISVSTSTVGSGTRTGLDDLLASNDGGKNDYDWLLTPPETPLCASSERTEFQSSLATPRRSLSRSNSITKPSRLSTGQSDSNHSTRPARSSSVTRSSVSSTISGAYSSNRSSTILNTSSASVSSYIRPSSPVSRSSLTARPSTPSNRTTSSRSSTPSKPRSTSSSIISSSDKNRQSQNSRPSTPSRAHIPANSTFPVTRSNSRPSTPTRSSPSSTPSSAPSISIATGRVLSNGRSQTSTSRASSPSPRIRQQQPVIPPDFPVDTPPNLRTSLSDRPVSAGRSRPNSSLTSKVNTDTYSSVNMPRRPSSPFTSRGRSAEPHGRGHLHSNGCNSDVSEPRKSIYGSDSMRKPLKTTTMENGGMGRTISKKSLDMAIRHMDIRNGAGSMRPISSTSLFPQSVRSVPSRIQTGHGSGSPTSVNSNESPSLSNNGSVIENGTYANGFLENGKREETGRLFGRLTGADLYESTRYDAILLKEDLKNTTWLHSVDDMSDQCSIFENGFEHLPEPFNLS